MLTDLGEDADLLGRLIANHKAGTANASALQKWLDLPATDWENALAAVRQMPADFRQELRDKFNADEETQEEGNEDEDYVPKPAASLFKGRKNKDVVDKLKAIDIKADRGRDTSADDAGKKDLTRKLNNIFKPLKRLKTKAVDVALFGRMIAEIKDGAMTVDAACQVAHAISTHRVAMESDYFTAVEELKEIAEKQGAGQDAGAGMIGTVDFNSACFYRYAAIDLHQLIENLDGERDIAKKAAEGFLGAFVHAVPTGKQNSFAAHNRPSLVYATVRTGSPVSLANAFVKPIVPTADKSLVERSITELDRHSGQINKMYGNEDLKKASHCQLEDGTLPNLGDMAESVDALIKNIVAAAFDGKGTA